MENGRFVQVHYTGTLANGDIFDSSADREPLEFEIGAGMVIPAFEEAVKAMKIDEEKKIHITAADAYGVYREEMTQRVPIADVKEHLVPEPGIVLEVMLQDGSRASALVKDVTETEVVLDFNHPLAGQDLTFELKLVGTTDEATQTSECGCGDDEEGGGCSSCGCGCSN